MKLLLPLMVTASLAFGQPRPATDNPFLATYTTPFGVPPFDKIRTEHFEPAFEEGMRQQTGQIQNMLRRRDMPTFENTIVVLDNSGDILDRVSTVFYNLNSANTSDEIQKIAQKLAPKLSKHHDDIQLNADLFKRVKAIYDKRQSLKLTTEQLTLLEKTYKNFVRSGAALSPEKQARLREINQEQSLLTLKYGQNLLGENNAFALVIDKESDLSGLPASLVASAAEEAKKRMLAGKWVFTLQNPSVMPFLQYADNRELREKIFKAYIERANHDDARDNKENIKKIVALRAERAKLLGYENHAAYVLEESMAKTPAKVNELLSQLWSATVPVTKKEATDLQAMMDKEGKNEKLAGWDWRYYAEKLRKEKYNLDEEELRPYFSLENVKQGIFTLSERLYGLKFEARPEIPVYHPEAMAYEVKEANGKHVGIIYMDFFPRASKRGGAWMTSYRKQEVKNGKFIAPVVSIVCNFSKPVGNAPALLSMDETTTFFHEFGHALHGLLSNVNYGSLSGTSVPRDFVELPSQIMENWATEPEMLKLYAKHYQTGEVIPEALVEKLKKSGLFNQGFLTSEYLAASILDMAYHTLAPGQTPSDVLTFEKETMNKIGLIEQIPPRYRSTYFQHSFSGGYSAGYYSYIWSAVLDADAFEVFKQKGLFDKKSAESFRKNVLERGGTDEPMKLYKNFRGAEPDIKPLLRRRGLLTEM
ncbi:M3 family metallopeptidase [Siphonobacter sp. SORGH_AS_0500]|uniref:M3 family metallopeptidase n=1 Tax=Siphonobacter sp. SORGH_AS_0500 TaxID=1864824 RepID=UPI002855C692|nr:M3 family metallopeptidase [Siphonobacter sp. SORGH_AS_0500]MDR6193840.1 peptidyl-dipeptidase Dcp [Siphonobacter sp. SORGH_AS_0500]